MKPERLPSWEALGKGLEILMSDASVELIVLKMHLMTEAHLYRLLSFRLEIDEDQLPTVQFFPLAKLALGGENFKRTLVKVLALNDLRNEFSHELDETRLDPAYEKFCAKTGMFWPPNDVANEPVGFMALRKGAVGAGASACVSEVWQHLTRLVAIKLGEAGKDNKDLLGLIAASQRLLDETQSEQNKVRRKFVTDPQKV